MLSAEFITSIVFGILQLTIGFISLWQQRHLRQANCTLSSIPTHQPRDSHDYRPSTSS
ncbi:hypothetical protein M501DRAFT_999359 [Patellaria atrata CBS 101060]|uniref:Uncharacterized protein n=1 Tax=Patellaria atrata CBS 101060 TaxID=1346257 RepID=A0A9P4S339_9PEZI|nr:hypothetical protein M501DRAFT_999359 [Patellaria atrata CBS 101060]